MQALVRWRKKHPMGPKDRHEQKQMYKTKKTVTEDDSDKNISDPTPAKITWEIIEKWILQNKLDQAKAGILFMDKKNQHGDLDLNVPFVGGDY
jgi:hypothetical protein